ncbi:alpha/beta hydrolase [Brevibacillus parabrevis]|uniref:alpha/beta fold hydrolase n=1 Tax=Brevibacillus parabrevis TaxID=54914 RepID=UPI0007ABBA4E|nr:alpha/beta hydrolase [Brevibacillus parabrevis]KZE49392.1 alpha/beta hydrolase [Brevibacillus parabrevis]
MKVEQVKHVEVEAGRLEYSVSGHADAPALLLLHAIRNSRHLFATMLPELEKHYRVVAVDLRGHGNSTDRGPFTFERIVDDLACLLEQERLSQVTIVAASFSAVPAQMLAVHEPQRIASLVLLDGGYYSLGEMPGFEHDPTVERLSSTRFQTVEEAERQFAKRYGGRKLPAGWMSTELVSKEDGGFGYRLPREAFDGYFHQYATYDLDELFRQLTCKVLLLLADENHLPDEAQRSFFREAVAKYESAVPQAQVRTIANSMHLLMVTHPDETVNEIKLFLHR